MSLSVGWHRRLSQKYRLAEAQALKRSLTVGQSLGPGKIRLGGKDLLNFSSNDYLGLSKHPVVINAFIDAARQMGVGATASHLLFGHTTSHALLEEELAVFLGRERVLLFSSGYAANLGVISALADRHCIIHQDRLNHASLLDGALLARARLKRYAHDALPDLSEASSLPQMVVSDGVFSMDGDLLKGALLSKIARAADALLIVDDAHGIGVMGAGGRGTLEAMGLDAEDVPVLIGTLGKAFGTGGAFVAGDKVLIDHLVQFARPYIYTTAMPPALAEATRASLRLVQEDPSSRCHLHRLIDFFRSGARARGLPLMASETPIQPIRVGGAGQVIVLMEALQAQGVLVGAVRPPTVPPGGARLRCALSASHSLEDLEKLLDALHRVFQRTMPEVLS